MLEFIRESILKLRETSPKMGIHEFIELVKNFPDRKVTEYYSLSIDGNVLFEVVSCNLFELNKYLLSDREFCEYMIDTYKTEEEIREYSINTFKNLLTDEDNFDEVGNYINDVWRWSYTEVTNFNDGSHQSVWYDGYEYSYDSTSIYERDYEVYLGYLDNNMCQALVWNALNYNHYNYASYEEHIKLFHNLYTEEAINSFCDRYNVELDCNLDTDDEEFESYLRVYDIKADCIACLLYTTDDKYLAFDGCSVVEAYIFENQDLIKYYGDDVIALIAVKELFLGGW